MEPEELDELLDQVAELARQSPRTPDAIAAMTSAQIRIRTAFGMVAEDDYMLYVQALLRREADHVVVDRRGVVRRHARHPR